MKLIPFVFAAVVAVAVAGSAEAAFVAWDTASGSSPGNDFDYSGGGSGDGSLPAGDDLWGEPTVTDIGFFFSAMESTFEADATGGGSDSIVSTMQVRWTADQGGPYASLHIYEYGTYSGNWGDFSGTYGSVSAFFFNPFAGQKNLGDLNIFATGSSTWAATLDVDLTSVVGGGGANDFQLQVTNHLAASAGSIQKTGGWVVTPEPSTLFFGFCGLVTITLRRPRRGRSR